jgi:hypothetical protein
MDAGFEFLRTMNIAKTVIVCGTFLIVVFIFREWVETTEKNIKLWPPEISTPESEQIQACRTIQAASHDDVQTLEHEIQSAYTTIDNDQKALAEQTRLRVAAAEQDRVIQKDNGGSSYYATNVSAVDERITELSKDIDWRDKIIGSRRQQIDNVSDWVYSQCAAILAGR